MGNAAELDAFRCSFSCHARDAIRERSEGANVPGLAAGEPCTGSKTLFEQLHADGQAGMDLPIAICKSAEEGPVDASSGTLVTC